MTRKIINQPPPRWKELYSRIEKMRLENPPAPVDLYGCERIPIRLESKNEVPPQPTQVEPIQTAKQRFRLFVSLLLSAQTKDAVTYAAVENLQTHLDGGLTIHSIIKSDPKSLDKLICKVGFHNRKSNYLYSCAKILHENFNDDIPKEMPDILKLPGIGPKMAHLLVQSGWNITLGIGVDVHVFRLTKMWKWVDSKTAKTPEDCRKQLELWLPKEYWRPINVLLVGFGQTICRPGPGGKQCQLCLLAPDRLCPAVDIKKYNSFHKNDPIRLSNSSPPDMEDIVVESSHFRKKRTKSDIQRPAFKHHRITSSVYKQEKQDSN